MTRRPRARRPAVALRPVAAGAALAMLAAPALAQTSEGGSSFNAGYGWTSGQVSSPVNVSRAYDANGNHVIVDGVTQTGQDGSVFYGRQTSGAGDTYTGAGALGGTAIGNNLQVSVTGNNNTVVVNSTQTNNAPVTATTVLNGQVNLDGGNGL
ncbi:MAG: holdfast anchoring protein HfaA [Caulobacteraceae bacterium]|nr:holdfast anchoring protein HfaA [Caulobacter sp.]